MTSFNLNYPFEDAVSKYSHIGVKTLTCELGVGAQFSPKHLPNKVFALKSLSQAMNPN